MTNLERFNQETMSSLEIAEITGKLHKDVLEAIRNMEPAWEKVSGRKFPLAEYTDAQGKLRPMYKLSKSECLYVATKFNDEARAKLIIRWEYLENTSNNTSLNEEIKAKTIAADFAIKALNLNGASKLLIVKSITEPLGLPTPDYAESKGAVKCASALLKEFGEPCKIAAFNQLMIDKGFMVEMERPSRSSKTGKKKYKNLTEAGLYYGENQTHPYNQKETQPMYYVDKFGDLLTVLNLKISA